MKQRLGINELWRKAKEHAREILGSDAELILRDFGEEGGLYYALFADRSENQYRYYCERK